MFPKFVLKGAPHEIGYAHGSLAKKQIEKCIEVYEKLFWSYSKITWKEAAAKSEQYIPYIQKYDPHIWEEIQGIADGSGRSLLDIVALNARSEIMLTAKALDGCTSFGVLAGAAGGKSYMGQNWDWKEEVTEAVIALEIYQDNKPAIKMITEAGIVGKFGINDAGVGLCMNALACEENIPGVPLHVVMRGILNSPNLSSAISAVINTQIASSVNFVIGHKDGEVIDMEVTPSEFDVLYPEQGIMVHTNHFLSPLLRPRVKDITKHLLPDTLVRYSRAKHILSSMDDSINLIDLQTLLADHFNHPHGVCRHHQYDPLDRQLVTVFSIIIDLTYQEIWVSAGKPCEAPYNKLFV
ncbi:MAG: C45 family peptidase [Bacillota bacterium]